MWTGEVTPPQRVTLTTWGPPLPCKQALIKCSSLRDFKIRPVSNSYPESSGYSVAPLTKKPEDSEYEIGCHGS